jgi:hypothetical protein
MKTHKLKVTLNEIKRMQELAGIQTLKESMSNNQNIEVIVNFKKSQLEFYDPEEHDLIGSFEFEPLANGTIDTDKTGILDLFKNDYSFNILIKGIDYEGKELRNLEMDDVIRNPKDLMDTLNDAVLDYDSMMNLDAMGKLG